MNNIFKTMYLSLVYLFLYIPIFIVIAFSFNNSAHSLLWHGFTWQWYQTLFEDHDLMIIAIHSLILATIASIIATGLGFIASTLLTRFDFFGKKSLVSSLFMLIVIPDIVIAIALLLLFSMGRLPLGFGTMLIAHITFCLPFACIMIHNRTKSLNPYLIEAAKDLGASEWRLYTRILIPLLIPSLIAALLMSFILSFDDVVISYFVSGPNFMVLPLKIFSMVRQGVSPEINALCTVLLLFTLTIVFAGQYLLRKKVK